MKSKSKYLTSILNYIMKNRAVVLLFIISIYIVAFSISYTEAFFNLWNLSSVLLSMAPLTFVVIGIAILLISGEIDLSVGWNMSLSGIICAHLIVYEKVSVPGAIIITLLISAGLGAIIGFIVSKFKVNSFITTLAAGLIYYGLSLKISGGSAIKNLPDSFNIIGQQVFLGMQLPVWFALIFTFIFALLVSKLKFFRQFYYIGNNEKAAKLSGINIFKCKLIGFIISSCLAGVSGILSAARFGNAMTAVGQGVEINAITAALIGGVSFSGGIGSVAGAVIGALFLACVKNGLIIGEVNQFLHRIIIGIIFLSVLIIDALINKKRK